LAAQVGVCDGDICEWQNNETGLSLCHDCWLIFHLFVCCCCIIIRSNKRETRRRAKYQLQVVQLRVR
jgi:hypothetical protein